MSKRNDDMRNNRNDKNNKPGLAKKVYAIAMSVMMVVSLWPANAGLAVADELAAALNGDGTAAATPAVPLEADSTVEPETKGADEAPAAPGADAGDAADAAAGDEPADAAPAVPSFAEHSDAAAQSSEAQARAVAEQGAAASPTGFVPGQYGNYTYSVNTIKDAFTATGEFSQFRDPQAESTLGVAGDFHITAFNEAANNCHVYGNVLAKTLNGGNNFGLRDDFFNIYNYYGLTYVQKLNNSTGNLDGRTNGTFVVGNDNKFEAVDNGSRLSINGSKRDTPQNFIQDADSASAPFIDIDVVYADSLSRSASMAAVADVGVSKKIEGNRATLTYSAEKGCAYTSMTASELNGIGDQLIIDGMNSKGQCSMVINVDMQGQSSVTIPRTRLIIDGKQASGGEIDYDTGFVLFNFYNAGRGTTINIGEAVASALAPDANINLTNGNACGTYIGYNVTASAESHARPFHGKLEPVVDGVSVTKQWLDAYGNAEADSAHSKLSVEAQLYQSKDGGEWVAYGDPVELNAANKWTYNWTGLPKKDVDGNSYGSSYEYKVEEVKDSIPAGYSQEGDAVREGDTWVLTNRRDAVGKLSVSKAWDDSDDADQIRPDSVTVELVRQAPGADDEVVDTKELNASNNWSAFWDQLQLTNASGNACTYTVRERAVDGYTSKVDQLSAQTDDYGNKSWSYQVTNSHALFEKTSVSVNKHWLNSNGTAETGEHGPVKVQLYKTVDGQTSPVEGKVAELSEDNAWSASFDGLAKKTLDGKEISYSVAEVEVPAGYEASTSHDGDSWTVTNTREATLSVKGQKVWDDVNDLDRLRPDSATLTLVRSVNGEIDPSFSKDYELSESNGWSFSESGLPAKDADGNAYTYSVLEKNVPDGYEVSYASEAGESDALGNATVVLRATNRHKTENKYTSVTVSKEWLNAAGNADEGEHPAVKAQLLKSTDGGKTFSAEGDAVTLSKDNDWSYTWDKLVSRDESGQTFTYKVEEAEVPEGFAAQPTQSDGKGGFTLVNKRLAKVSISASKAWDDHDDADQIRPDSVTVEVLRKSGAMDTAEKVGSFELSAANGWEYHSGYDFDAADADGNAYTYSLREALTGDDAQNYISDLKSECSTEEDGNVSWSFSLTNKHEVKEAKTSVTVNKRWLTAAGEAEVGTHPAVHVRLVQFTVGEDDAQKVVAEADLTDKTGWSHTWEDLVARDSHGVSYTYEVRESGAPEGYDSRVEAEGDGVFTIYNQRRATVSVKGSKAWDDKNDVDHKRPGSVRVTLRRSVDGGAVENVKSYELSEANGWSFSEEGLPAQDKDGKEYAYSLAETKVDGYEEPSIASECATDAAGNVSYSFKVTNTHRVESHKTNVMVNKSWLNAAGNPDEGEHPAVKAQLYKRHVEGGSIVEEPVDGPVELSAANNWSYTWADQVERDEDGVAYTYDVREVECPDGFAPEATTSADNSFTLVNKREATVSVAAQKSWADDGDADGVRPDSVTVRVKRSVAGGQPEDTGTVLTLVEDNGWHAEADGLPAADADGNAYEYQLVEDPIEGYEGTAKISESVDPSTGVKTFSVELTNRHERQKTKVVVSKAWDDEDNQDGIRPQKVTVALKRTVEGTEATEDVRQIELNGQNGWKAEVDDLPVAGVIDGRKGKFAYTVEEARVDGYEGKVELAKQADGSYAFAVTNRHEAAKTSVNVRKVWDDGDDIDRLRPESVKAQLCVKQADGQVVPVEGVDPVILNEDNNWSAGWTDLDARKDGEDMQYTVQEVEVPDGYEVEVSDGVSDDDGASYTYTMTNKHQTEECDFSLTGYSVASVNDILQPDDECYVDPKIVKRLDGRALEAGEFKFQLVDEKTGEVVSTAFNDESGMVDFDKAANVAPDGMDASCLKFTKEGKYSYIVKEVSESKDPSIDYSNEVVKFVVKLTRDSDGRLVADGGTYYYENAGSTLSKELPPDEHPTITNSVEPISLSLRKTDADGTKDLSGATYGLYKADDNAKVAEAVSGEDGIMVFTSADMPISEGVKYYFLEISAPDGYLLDKTPTSAFTIGHSGTGSSIEYHATFDDGHVSESATFGQTIAIDCGTVTDKSFGIVLSKVDADGKGIKGAKLEVREATGSKAIDSWESNGAGHVLSGVQPGVKYVFHEASAPSGYAQASDVEFTVDASGKVSIVSGGKATVSGKGVVNAYAGDASLTMIDYKKDEKVDHKTTERSEPRTTTKDRSIPQTGDTSASPLWLVVAAIVVTVAGFYLWRKSR